MKLTVEEIAHGTGGRILQRHQDSFESFGIDSRKIPKGGLFFAMKGENTDGHLFLQDAFRNGAAGAVVERAEEPFVAAALKTLILVNDTMKAIQDLAAFVRKQSPSKYVGITGSSGKTSTKEFTAELLAKTYAVYKSEGNLNSLTGLPLSLLSMEQKECAVFEVAMNHPGEIERLSKILKPDVGVIMNVNPVHAVQFSSINEIADEKCSLIQGMLEDSTVIYNADDLLLDVRLRTRKAKFLYGFSPKVDLRITDVRMRGVRGSNAVLVSHGRQIPLETELCGFGNLYNIAAAVSVALTMNVPVAEIADGITQLRPFQQRGILIRKNGIHIYDDTYNSNPKALEMILKMAGESTGYNRKIAVLGDMLELGPDEEKFHADAGEQVAMNQFDILITTGPLSRHMGNSAEKRGITVYTTDSSTEAAEKAASVAEDGDLIIVKGSRGMKMEVVVEKLTQTK